AMKDTTGHAYFANLHVLPEKLHGVRLLKGIELNILDFDGKVDMDDRVLSRLDLAIASLHVPCITPGSRKENTRALLKVMENPYVDIIGHPGDPRYDVDFREVFRQARETGTLLEINNASLIPGGFRDGSQENVKELLRMSMEDGVSVVLGSDAHFYTGIGDFSHALHLLKEVGFPAELVLNTEPVRFLAALKKR
ncbi:MAG: phosphatase, partial [Anaerotignum sp.]|nr:phosphatase [Anaerotignum sp.]